MMMDRLFAILTTIAGILYLAGAAVTVADVQMRWWFNAPIRGAIEMTAYLIGAGALFSIPDGFARRSHITAQLLSDLVGHRGQRALGYLGMLASVVFVVLLCVLTVRNALGRVSSVETTPELGLPLATLWMIAAAGVCLWVAGALVGLLRYARKTGGSHHG